jgi:hypothetical protein
MARLTIEELKKDPLIKGDFERMKIMGLDPNEPWALVCKILDFCDDDYFNLKVKSLFSVYIAGYTACYCKFINQIIEKAK